MPWEDEVNCEIELSGDTVGFEVFTAVIMKSTRFRDVTRCNLMEVYYV
jgi:hypothetical protein